MNNDIKNFHNRLQELLDAVPEIDRTKKRNDFGDEYLDEHKYTRWRMCALTVLEALASGTHFVAEFKSVDADSMTRESTKLSMQAGILAALKEDFERGLLSNIRGIVRAEVFSDLLDQARYLYDEKYILPSAVIAGAVLENHLRKLCGKHPTITLPPKPKLDSMNSDLARAGEYDNLVQKEVTFWAGVRNKAAHGESVSEEHAQVLLDGVLRFINTYRS